MTKARKTEASLFFNISFTIVTNRLWSAPVDIYLVGIFSIANQEPLNNTSVPSAVTSYSFTSFLNDYPLVLSREVLSQEVPYLGGDAEINFYVEGLRFTDKDFSGLISINLSVLEPISEVSASNISFNSSHHSFMMYSTYLF